MDRFWFKASSKGTGQSVWALVDIDSRCITVIEVVTTQGVDDCYFLPYSIDGFLDRYDILEFQTDQAHFYLREGKCIVLSDHKPEPRIDLDSFEGELESILREMKDDDLI